VNKKIGWLGVFFALFVNPAQLIRIWQTGETTGISPITYTFLTLALICYLYEAIRIKSKVFMASHLIGVTTSTIILGYLIWG